MGKWPEVVAEIFGVMAGSWIGWLLFALALLFMFWTLKMVRPGRLRRFLGFTLPVLGVGVAGVLLALYLSVNSRSQDYTPLMVLILSYFLIIVAVATMLAAIPVALWRRWATQSGATKAE